MSYLNGDLTPKQAQEAGYAGIDYEDQVWRAHPTWIKEAKQLGPPTNPSRPRRCNPTCGRQALTQKHTADKTGIS